MSEASRNLDAIGERLDPGAAEQLWQLRAELVTDLGSCGGEVVPSQKSDPIPVKVADSLPGTPSFGPLTPIMPVPDEPSPGPRPEPRRWQYHVGGPCGAPAEDGTCGCTAHFAAHPEEAAEWRRQEQERQARIGQPAKLTRTARRNRARRRRAGTTGTGTHRADQP
jgi:hypothetical protein